MKPTTLKLDPMTQGDTFEEIPSISLRKGASAPDGVMRLVTMRFRKEGVNAGEVVQLSSDVAEEIDILNEAEWSFKVLQQDIPGLTFGKWQWRIRVTDAEGVRHTWLTGELEILESI
jgi:hypothetical protein